MIPIIEPLPKKIYQSEITKLVVSFIDQKSI